MVPFALAFSAYPLITRHYADRLGRVTYRTEREASEMWALREERLDLDGRVLAGQQEHMP